jgi:hypothetical protein
MVTLEQVKADLPTWPDDLLEEWLVYLANRDDTGWPPPNPLGDHAWAFILGHRPIPWWQEVTWKLEKTNCSLENLSGSSQRTVTQMLAAIGNGSIDEGTRRRFQRQFHFILDNGAFIKPLVAMKIADGLSILDGSHQPSGRRIVRSARDARQKISAVG